jgi:hypothetical protein
MTVKQMKTIAQNVKDLWIRLHVFLATSRLRIKLFVLVGLWRVVEFAHTRLQARMNAEGIDTGYPDPDDRDWGENRHER